jgi:hypothetical protein
MSLAARLAQLFLVAALLAGWQAALEHPVRHVDEHGGFVHGSQDEGGAAQLACDAIAAVGTAVGGAAPLPFFDSASVEALPQFSNSRFASAIALAYRSQAPPQAS